MIKMIFCLHRRPDLSREEFQRYWLERHGPLVRASAAALGLRRYVQAHTSSHPLGERMRRGRGAPEPFDGVAELWWDGIEDLAAAMATEAGREAGRRLVEDERRFIDLARSPLWIAEEHVVV